MYSVGILSGKRSWPKVLAEMLKDSGSNVSGWINPGLSTPSDIRQLIDYSDMIWIPEKINGGMEEAIQVIRQSRHLSLGFPVVEFIEEVPGMVKLAHEARVQVQVGHHDWYHPAVRSSLMLISHPQSIQFTDHLPKLPVAESRHQLFGAIVTDLDLVLGIAGSTVRRVRPHVSRMLDDKALQVDIRVELHNGTVINLSISNFTDKPERRLDIIATNRTVSIDLLNGTSSTEVYQNTDNGFISEKKEIWPPVGSLLDEKNRVSVGELAVARQCLSFIHALERGRHSLSSLEGGYKALEITRQIEIITGAF
jgi:predicted dehydrogenase